MLSDSLERVKKPMMSQIFHGVTLHPISIQLFHPSNEVDYKDLSSKQNSSCQDDKKSRITSHIIHTVYTNYIY